MYFRLTVDYAAQNVYVQDESDEAVSFISGALLPLDPDTRFDFSMQVDDDEEGDRMAPLMFGYFPNHSLMHRRLVEVLEGAGVDNLQTFPAVIVDEDTGETHADYVVANVIGLVSCANVAASDAEPLADVHYFHELVLDPSQGQRPRLFRLAESQMEIIVDGEVAAAIEDGKFSGIVLEPLREAPSADGGA